MPLISDWGHLRTHGAPRISRKLPTPDLAFHAGAVTATECYDLASRVQRPWTESNFQPYQSPAGPGLFQFTSAQTAVRNGATRDLDTTNFVTVYTVWVEFLGTATSPQALYFYEGTVGNRVRLQWNTNGFQIGSYGGLTTPITLLAKADVKRGLNTVVMACSDNTGKIYLNGALIYTATTAQAWAAAQTELRIFNSTGSGSESIVPVLQGATWTGFYDQFAEYLSQRPENLFEPRQIWVPVSAGGGSATDLTIQDATHGHTADGLTITVASTLAIQDAAHAHIADSPTISLGYVDLAIADATHAHTADNLTLSVSGATDLVIQDATHGQSADSLALTLGYVDLMIADTLHGHTADNITLGGLYTDLELILKILSNRQELNAGTGTFTIYDDDSVSVLFTASAWADAAGTVPYSGGTLGRIDALA